MKQSQMVATIPLYKRSGAIAGYAIVDPKDAPNLNEYRWAMLSAGTHQQLYYAVRYERSDGQYQMVSMHRQVLGLTGRHPEVDHINHNGLDNRKDNLRQVSHGANLQNRRPNVIGTSRHRGVYWETRGQTWRAQGRLNGRKYHIGNFVEEEAAAIAAAEWRREHMPYSAEALSK